MGFNYLLSHILRNHALINVTTDFKDLVDINTLWLDAYRLNGCMHGGCFRYVSLSHLISKEFFRVCSYKPVFSDIS